ncbi:MAG: hypothetical protein ACPGYX_02950 [Oceanobacter sp.]
MNKDKAYHQIALSCLKTLRATSADKNDAVAELHGAIDKAFQEQFALVLAELEDCQNRLMLINALNPSKHSLTDAQQIAVSRDIAH